MGARVLVIGAGFSGICMGIALKRAGSHDFVILEKSDRVGGTWRDNVYPGCACDSPAHLYQFSFEPKPDWSRLWVGQDEIQRYLEHCAQTYDLTPHIHFHTAVQSARWERNARRWSVVTAAGLEYTGEVLVSGVGQLHRPRVPALPGLERFTGPSFHSANWNHDVDLNGKRVVVVGNAASAVQFVPHLAPRAARLTIVQRSPNWVLPRNDRAFTPIEQARFAHWPAWSRLHRWMHWWRHEWRGPERLRRPRVRRRLERLALRHLESQVPDTALRSRLVPDYPIGAKRVLLSDDYYPTLLQPHVELVTGTLARAEPDAVVTADGRRLDADVLVFATGFDATHFLAPLRIAGIDGTTLAERWHEGAEAYLGISVARFPNLFLMYGPNTNLGHNSVVFMIECQARYIVGCLRMLERAGAAALAVKPAAEARFVAELRRRLGTSVWTRANNWYTSENGRITTNWPGGAIEYWWRTRRPCTADYELDVGPATGVAVTPRSTPAVSQGGASS